MMIGPYNVDFDPSQFQTPGRAAKAFHHAFRKAVTDKHGLAPWTEFTITNPATARYQSGGHTNCWIVRWETSDVVEWAVGASLNHVFNREAGWYTETNNGQDLLFLKG